MATRGRPRTRPDWGKELGLTAEERAGAEKYIEWTQVRRLAARMIPFYAEIDRQWPELDAETRTKLADHLYRKQMAEFGLKSLPTRQKGR